MYVWGQEKINKKFVKFKMTLHILLVFTIKSGANGLNLTETTYQ